MDPVQGSVGPGGSPTPESAAPSTPPVAAPLEAQTPETAWNTPEPQPAPDAAPQASNPPAYGTSAPATAAPAAAYDYQAAPAQQSNELQAAVAALQYAQALEEQAVQAHLQYLREQDPARAQAVQSEHQARTLQRQYLMAQAQLQAQKAALEPVAKLHFTEQLVNTAKQLDPSIDAEGLRQFVGGFNDPLGAITAARQYWQLHRSNRLAQRQQAGTDRLGGSPAGAGRDLNKMSVTDLLSLGFRQRSAGR